MNTVYFIAAIVIVAGGWIYWTKFRPIPKALHLGPIVNGKSATKGTKLSGRGFAFPYPNRDAGHVHALVQPVSALSGKITAKWSILANEGTTFHPQENHDERGEMSLMIMRKGDNAYSKKGPKEFYRLYAPNPQFIKIGDGEMTADLTPAGWIGVLGVPPSQEQFDDVMQNIATIQLCFGGGGSRAHGVYASGPAALTLLELG